MSTTWRQEEEEEEERNAKENAVAYVSWATILLLHKG